MRHIYYTVGHPPEEMLNPALYAREFYSLRLSSIGKLVWRFLVRFLCFQLVFLCVPV